VEHIKKLLSFPSFLGMEVSGVVDALGSNVTNLSIGDRVAVFGGHGGLG
jgi:NADPH2:quinone reductase